MRLFSEWLHFILFFLISGAMESELQKELHEKWEEEPQEYDTRWIQVKLTICHKIKSL